MKAGMSTSTKRLLAERKSFMAESKPGHLEAFDLRVLNNERRKNEVLQAEIKRVLVRNNELLVENKRLFKEISRLSHRYTKAYRAVKKVFESGAGA